MIFAMAFPPEAVGSGVYAFRLARGLAERGCRVQVVAPQDRAGRWALVDSAQSFGTVRVPAARTVPERYWTARRWLRHVVADFRPHVLWATNGMATRVAGWTRELDGRNPRIISSIRGSDITTRLPGSGPWARLESVYQRRCYARSAAISTASEYLRQVAVAKGVDGSRIFVNPPAFDFTRLSDYTFDPARLERAIPGLRDRKVVLTVARLVKQKRVDVVVEAMAHVQSRVPEALLVIVGGGPQRAALERRARTLPDHVRFAGPVEPMSTTLYDLYSAARVFVMAGVREGMGNVFLEAGALGTPSVGVNDGGVPEVIQHERTGMLAEPDDPVDLAGKLEQMLTDDELARAMGSQAHAWIKAKFSTGVMMERSYAVLRRVLDDHAGCAGAEEPRPAAGEDL